MTYSNNIHQPKQGKETIIKIPKQSNAKQSKAMIVIVLHIYIKLSF